jgi:O-succinylbenzoic acid--CoA ligase
VFPEQVELRLLAAAREAGLPLRHLLLLAEPDPLWGERLVALVRAERSAPIVVVTSDGGPDGDPLGAPDSPEAALISPLEILAAALPPSQRPRRWLACPELAPSPLGKWPRRRWREWLQQRPEGP